MARMVIVCGLPGTGKTTLAVALERDLPALRLSPDDWMQALGHHIWDNDARLRVEELQRTVSHDALRCGTSVVIEWGTWARAERDRLRAEARALGVEVELRFLDAPVEVLHERITERGREAAEGRAITLDELREWSEAIERPTPDELALFDPIASSEYDAWLWAGRDVRVVDGVCVALQHVAMHPLRTWAALEVLAGMPTERLATALRAVAEAEVLPLRLRTEDARAVAAIEEAGGWPLVRSYEVVVAEAPPVPGVEVEEVPLGNEELRAGVDALYRRIHAWDPVGEGETLPEHVYEDAFVAGVVREGDRVVAVGLVHHGRPNEAALLGCVEDHPDERSITAALVAWAVDRCGPIAFEVDEGEGAHPALLEVLRSLDEVSWTEPMVVWEVRADPVSRGSGGSPA